MHYIFIGECSFMCRYVCCLTTWSCYSSSVLIVIRRHPAHPGFMFMLYVQIVVYVFPIYRPKYDWFKCRCGHGLYIPSIDIRSDLKHWNREQKTVGFLSVCSIHRRRVWFTPSDDRSLCYSHTTCNMNSTSYGCLSTSSTINNRMCCVLLSSCR